VLAIAGFAGAAVIGLGLIGPWAMGVLFGGDYDYGRVGLMLVGLGMGFHLTAGTLNQAALARHRGGQAAAAWLAAAVVFMVWLLPSPLDDPVLAVEIGYCATAALLAGALWLIDRTSAPGP
jgi:O-antigen/teichoic acid export membrane protein